MRLTVNRRSVNPVRTTGSARYIPTTGDQVNYASQAPRPVEPGTVMQKAIPPRMVEPYLSGRRSIISGFAHRVADTGDASPRQLYDAFSLGFDGSDFSPDMPEVYVLRWRAAGTEAYKVPYSVENGGDWAMPPPFTGTGHTASRDLAIAEYFTDPIPVPVGAEIHRIDSDKTDFIARYDGQVWLRPTGGPELCATG